MQVEGPMMVKGPTGKEVHKSKLKLGGGHFLLAPLANLYFHCTGGTLVLLQVQLAVLWF